MIDIILLRVKLGRVAEGVRSFLSSISSRPTVAPYTCYMGVDDLLDLIIGFYYPTLPLGRVRILGSDLPSKSAKQRKKTRGNQFIFSSFWI